MECFLTNIYVFVVAFIIIKYIQHLVPDTNTRDFLLRCLPDFTGGCKLPNYFQRFSTILHETYINGKCLKFQKADLLITYDSYKISRLIHMLLQKRI